MSISITADARVQDLLTALAANDFAAARAHFDARMLAGLPQDRLANVWSATCAQLGKLTTWQIGKATERDGLATRVVRLHFEHGDLESTIAVHANTLELAGFLLRPVYTAGGAPAPYSNAAAFRAVDVELGRKPFVLGGTLTLPVGDGKFPAAILVHGSGPNDRDETIGANKPFKDIAEGLASRCIAVLRYDKRTFAHGARLVAGISVDDEVVLDAIAAVDLLRQRPEIDPDRIFVIGHSLGALLAPEIAVRAAKVAGVALLAPPGRPVPDMMLDQMRHVGVDPARLADVEEKVARLKSGTLGDELLAGAPQSYWRDLQAHDGVAMARRFGRPILILRGARDYQVLDVDVAAWRDGLQGTRGVTIDIVPADNHLFLPGEGKSMPAEYQVAGHVDPAVIERLVGFVRG
jgi:dienelactone hydrolase